MKPEFITFTGADDGTDLQDMESLADDYPVEFGILFSPKQTGQARYPSAQWVTALLEFVARRPMPLSAHVCGAYSRELIEYDTIRTLAPVFAEAAFRRVQVNTSDPKVQPALIGAWARRQGMQAILQCRGPFPDTDVVNVLFDASGGRGLLPGTWPVGLPNRLCGYAGGLRPENVAAAAAVIGSLAGPHWLDMETGVRNAEDKFDINLCRAVCEAVYGLVP